ncbi:MAG TPA: ComEC/Rec2 family competence protein [Terriglobales bacterium]|nr:ComEC/Rec2 family competence protein [Terriglobales bacterium]
MKSIPQKSGSRFAERQPMFWAALVFALGIMGGTYVAHPPNWWLAVAVILAFASLCFRERWTDIARGLCLIAMFSVGAFVMEVRPPLNPGTEILPYSNHQSVTIIAHVVREGDWQERGRGEIRQLLDLETEAVSVGGKSLPVRAGVRLGIYASDDAAVPVTFRYGQRLQCVTKLSPPHNFRDPGVFDYKAYLNENGIAVLGSTKTDEIHALPGFVGNRLEQWRARAHRSVIGMIHALWRPAEADLIDAMMIGDESFVSHESRMDFQRTGTYHLLVVSGMNVGILAFVTFWVLRRTLHMNEGIASLLAILVTAAYAFLTYVGPPVWRATLMCALFLGARLLYRQRSMLNAIGIAALGVLLADPHALFGASFQMTFLCVLVIAGVGVPLLERTMQPFARGARQIHALAYDRVCMPIVAQFRLDLRLIASRLGRFTGYRLAISALARAARIMLAMGEILFISLLMQLGMALPMAFYFHRVTVTALPANILVLPLTEIMMPAAVLAIGLGYVWLALAKIPALVASFALDAITGTIHLLGRLQIADLRVPTPAVGAILFAVCALGLAMLLARRRVLLATAGLFLLVASAFWVAEIPPRPELVPKVLEVTAIDVGQGDSLFLAFPDGRTALVDAGGMPQWMHSEFDIGEEVVSPYLWSRGIGRLDAVEVTHPHADHIGGIYAVLANFHPRELWIGKNTHSAEMDALVQEAQLLGIRVMEYEAGDSLNFGGAAIRFLAPTGAVSKKRRENDDSIVMKVTYENTSALLEGDAEKHTEKQIANENPQADLLKVAHHGSATSTIPELLAAVKPRFAVISVGANNVYGHPKPQVLERLATAGAKTYRTDLDGAVTFYLNGQAVTPQTAVPQ